MPSPTRRDLAPIGIESVTGKHPKEIAIAVAAELLRLGLSRAEAAHMDAPEIQPPSESE